MLGREEIGFFILAAVLLGSLCPALGTPAKPAPLAPSGEILFKQNCASCHPGGGNTARPDKPVANSRRVDSLIILRGYLKTAHKPRFLQLTQEGKAFENLYQYCKALKNEQAREASLSLPAL